MSIKITKDYKMIKKMLLEDKELYERISDDFTNVDKLRLGESEWFGFFENGDCLGLLSVHEETAVVMNIHIHIPKKNRGPRSFEIGNGLIDYVVENCDKRFIKINLKIPVCFPDVVKFAEKCGFEREGTDMLSHFKNGEKFDKACMGRTI